MKIILLFSLVFADLIGFNRQNGIANKHGSPLADTTQDQIIVHLAKNGQFKLLRDFLASVKRQQIKQKYLKN